MTSNERNASQSIARLPWSIAKTTWRIIWKIWSVLLTVTLLIAICAFVVFEWQSRRSLDPDQITLMPPPTIIAEGVVDPFRDIHPLKTDERFAIFYATGREPAREGDKQRYYRNQRGNVLRLGLGEIKVGDGGLSFDEIKEISVSKARDTQNTLSVSAIEEFGVLSSSLTPLANVPDARDESAFGDQAFAKRINQKLSASTNKDIIIYVHGYKVVFENPLLIACSLWHFTGYDGAMIAFAWPSTPNFMAYVSDLETTRYSSRDLRLLIEFLAENTDVERIHVLGYSAGTGLVMATLDQLGLSNAELTKDEVQAKYRIENVVLVCSDVDRGLFANQLANGAWKVPRHLVVYCSSVDSTLGMSRLIFARERLGQLVQEDKLSEASRRFLRDQDHITLIDVSNAENVKANNGHAYFHKSPWVSSDLLLTLTTGLTPQQRMLTRAEDSVIWRFPNNYVERLQTELKLDGDTPQKQP